MESKINFYQSFYETAMKLRDIEQRDAFVMGILAYAFEGKEPDFSDDLVLDIAFTNVKPNIDANAERAKRSRTNGANGGRKPKDKTQSKTQGETQVKTNGKTQTETQAKTQSKTHAHLEIERDKDKLKKIYPYLSKAGNDGSVNDEPEPHSQHICPSCGGDIATTDGIHTCTRCGKSTTNPQPKMAGGTTCPPEILARFKGGAA